MNRRTLLKTSLALIGADLPAFPAPARADDDSAGTHFDFDWLKKHARELAANPYQSPIEKLPNSLATLEPLKYQAIQQAPNKALWAGNGNTDVRMHFFHVGMHFNRRVTMHAVDPDSSRSRVIHFRPELFNYAESGVNPSALKGHDLGFAGFKLSINGEHWPLEEVASFLGASYFRAIDKNKQYGLSARGLAVDTGLNRAEEFPDFTDFWFVRPSKNDQVTVYALLDSPSVTGAYRFDMDARDKGVVMNVTMDIYTRADIERLGIAPMTSMFLKGTSQSQARDTIYPQVHDSDRLAMWRGDGEWISRPLFNPPTPQYNAFADQNPKGFGLVQHDHEFANYRDDVAWYNRRPSLWVEPTGDWGQGHIALLELPTLGETTDNIGAFWLPAEPVKAGQHLFYGYKLYWWPLPPVRPTLGKVEKTWTGMGNVPEGWIPGQSSPNEYARRFAVDFVGSALANLPTETPVEAQVEISRGKLGMVQARRLEPIQGYRAIFDWIPESASTEAVSMRLYLRAGDRPLTETWLYQWVPPEPEDRRY